MKKTVFGNTGLQVSRLGFGSAPLGYLGVDQARAMIILNRLLDAGVNLIDAACCYPGAEEMLGKCLGARRDELVLVTKCGHLADGVTGTEWSADVIAQNVERSLRLLQTDHLDVLLLHSCDLNTLQHGAALPALFKAQREGKTRFIGYSGDNDAAVYAARLPEIQVLELSINICDQRNIEQVLPIARERNLGVLAKRPIANAAWKPLTDQAGLYVSYARPYHERLQQMRITPASVGYDTNGHDDWPELALRFTLSQPGVHTAIVGTTNPANVAANLQIADMEPLPAVVIERLRAAFLAGEKQAGEPWVGLT